MENNKEEKEEGNLKREEDITEKKEEEIIQKEDKKITEDKEMPSQKEMKWYVLRVKSGKEEKVKETIEKKISLTEKIKEKIGRIIVPTEKVSEIRKGFKKIIQRKLYPGYIMIEMLKDDNTYYFIKSIPGVADIIGEVSNEEMEKILITCSQNRPKPKVKFVKGQVVKIKEGPFEGYQGNVDEVNEQRGIVKVKIHIFGRYTQVELGFWEVEIE